MASLDQLHQIQLEIFDEFLRICTKYNLHYVMMGGSCLGTIRHKGFIPWDDDIDVGMDRKDYNQLIEICKTELKTDFFFQHFDTEEKTGFIFGKLRKNHTKMYEPYSKHIEMHQGIWIDIFPFDYVQDDMNSFLKDYKKVIFFRNLLIVKQGYHLSGKQSLVDTIKYYCVKPITILISKKWLVSHLLELMTQYNAQPTHTLFPYGCAWAEKERISRREFYDNVKMDFENRKVNVFKNYDKYLTTMYGEYMQIPKDIGNSVGHIVSDIILDTKESEK